MGYMGLDNYGASDSAFDAAWTAIDAMAESLQHNLRTDKGNQYNTCGIVNVALFYEAFIIPNDEFESLYKDGALYKTARETLDKLNAKIELDSVADWHGDEENKNMHLTAYRRMAKSLGDYLDS